MKVNDLRFPELIKNINPDLTTNKSPKEDSAKLTFADTIKSFLNTVNDKQIEAGDKVAEVIQGESEDLAGAMSALQESNLSFQLMLEIRNKLIEAVQEVNRMQV